MSKQKILIATIANGLTIIAGGLNVIAKGLKEYAGLT